MAKYIRAIANPSRYRREKGVEFVSPLERQLDTLAKERLPNGAPRYYFFMHQFPKVGLNPHAEYNTTPLGVYGYPLNEDYLSLFRRYALPYGSDRAYMTILEATDPDHMLVINTNPVLPPGLDRDPLITPWEETQTQTDLTWEAIGTFPKDKIIQARELNPYLYKLEQKPEVFLGALAYAVVQWDKHKDEILQSPYSQYLKVKLKYLGREAEPYAYTPARFTKDLLRQGYTSVFDNGTSNIHINEPTQVVFLSPKSYRVVGTLSTSNRTTLYDEVTQENLARFKKERLELLNLSEAAWFLFLFPAELDTKGPYAQTGIPLLVSRPIQLSDILPLAGSDEKFTREQYSYPPNEELRALVHQLLATVAELDPDWQCVVADLAIIDDDDDTLRLVYVKQYRNRWTRDLTLSDYFERDGDVIRRHAGFDGLIGAWANKVHRSKYKLAQIQRPRR